MLLLPGQAGYFLARIPGARLVRLDGLGHTPMYDDPARVAGVILERTTAHPSRPAVKRVSR
jgi:pimeloyl-ACP methyl ester carboxylesterase